jgi:Zn-dependent protease with chaperone function
MCIEDPKGRLVNEHSGFFADLMATHPPLEKRIEALKSMNYSA